jgi:hypothetical protein
MYMLEAFQNGMCIWFTPKDYVFVLLAPRYTLDEQRRLHNQDSCALEWLNGEKQYWYHGVEVPKEVILDPRSLNRERILGEPNAELKRIMMERYGYGEFLEELRPVVLDDTKEGRLLQVTVPGEQTPFLLMDVRDHTDPQQRYLIHAHRSSRTIHEARAFSWGMDPQHFNPLVET